MTLEQADKIHDYVADWEYEENNIVFKGLDVVAQTIESWIKQLPVGAELDLIDVDGSRFLYCKQTNQMYCVDIDIEQRLSNFLFGRSGE